MRELLEKWAQLEPERCKLLYDGVVLVMDEEWVFPYATPYYADMFIQAAVQKAVRAQSWRYKLTSFDKEHQGEVSYHPVKPPIVFVLTYPAEALLAAYLGALETLNTKPIEA